MKALDIILFSGRGLTSRAIQLGSFSKYSHVGIMVDEHTLLESTTLNGANGVRTIALDELKQTYNGSMYMMESTVEIMEEDEEILVEFLTETMFMPYNKSTWEVMKSALGWLPNTKEDLSSYFCSELVIEVLQQMRFVKDDRPSDDYSPKEVSQLYKKHDWKKAIKIK